MLDDKLDNASSLCPYYLFISIFFWSIMEDEHVSSDRNIPSLSSVCLHHAWYAAIISPNVLKKSGGSDYSLYSLVRLTLKVLVTTIDAQWEGMGDVGSARYEPALLPPCPTIRVLSCSDL